MPTSLTPRRIVAICAAALLLAPVGLTAAHAQNDTYQEPPAAGQPPAQGRPNRQQGQDQDQDQDQGGRGQGRGQGKGMMQVLRQLKLSQDQREQLRHVARGQRRAYVGLMRQARDANDAFEQALFSGAPEAQLMPLLKKAIALHDQAEMVRAKLEIAVRGILTPDQLAQAKQAISNND